MKKVLALLLAVVMVIGMTTMAMAATSTGESATPITTATLDIEYALEGTGTSPAETFNLEFNGESYKRETTGADVEVTNIPNITWTGAEFAAGAAGSANKTGSFSFTMPTYTVPGIYEYDLKQVAGDTAGVTYDETEFTVVVKAARNLETNAIYVSQVEFKGADGKLSKLENTYSTGELAVKKLVTGNLGDVNKYFNVTVTFTAANGKTMKSTITYSGGKYSVATDASASPIEIKHNDTVTFTNIPVGTTWTVEEADYTGDGYDAAQYSKATGTMTAAGDSCNITNNKDENVDTGIVLDSLPYILIGVAVAAAAVLMVAKKRRIED